MVGAISSVGSIRAGWLARFLALACLACASSVTARADPLAGSIGTSVAGLEWQLERAERCQAAAENLQRRLDRLQTDPVANASLITETETRLLTNRTCAQSAGVRASNLELALAGLRGQFLTETRADEATFTAHVDGLRTAERERAVLALDIRLAQIQIDRLRNAVPLDQAALDQKIAVRDGLRSSLLAVVDRIGIANAALADFETAALDTLANRRATLTWTTPVTREDGAPLAVGELGGFEIYMLAESTGETRVFTVDDPMSTTYTVDGLAPDTYHFSMSAFDISGAFSPLSAIVAKTVR